MTVDVHAPYRYLWVACVSVPSSNPSLLQMSALITRPRVGPVKGGLRHHLLLP